MSTPPVPTLPLALLEFEAAWALTLDNLACDRREPLRPGEVAEQARSAGFRSRRQGRRGRDR